MKKSWLTEAVRRSETGPYMKETDFDKAVTQTVSELVQQHGLVYDPERVVPADDDLACRVYQAGLELFLRMGAYNMSTQRRILFSREEIEEAVGALKAELTLGTGKDSVVMRHRGVESQIPCVVHSGPTGTPCSEKYHPLILESCAQEPLVDCLGAGSVATYRGEKIIPGSPTEILGAQRDAAAAREATKRAGRSGMHINDVASPLTCAGKISVVHPEWGLRSSDGLLVSQMVELKTDYDQLSKAGYVQSAGMHVVDLMTPLVGGLGGGPPGTAVVTIACHLLGVLCYAASYHIYGHMHLLNSCDTDRMGLWIYSVGGQALALNSRIQSISAIYTMAGLGTQEVLWEIAAASMVSTVSGLHQGGVGATGGASEDQTSGLENRFNAQVSHATLGMTRDEVNAYALAFLRSYEESHENPPAGGSFSQLYGLEDLQPYDEWQSAYRQVVEAISDMGLDIRDAWMNKDRSLNG